MNLVAADVSKFYLNLGKDVRADSRPLLQGSWGSSDLQNGRASGPWTCHLPSGGPGRVNAGLQTGFMGEAVGIIRRWL